MTSTGPALQKIIEPVISRFLTGEYESQDLAAKIRLIIEDQSQHLPSQIAFSSLMSKFVVSGLDLLNFNDPKEQVKHKIAGLTIFDCLLDVNDEIMPERRIEIANHIGKVLENDKLSLLVSEVILRTASLSIGHFARVASTTEVEFLQNFYYPLALKLIVDSRSDAHRYAGAIILTQLAHFAPALIFSKRKVLFNVIWDAVCDKNKTVRTAAAATLEASLQVISQREAMSDYIRSALRQIDMGFSAAVAEKILGSLIILDTLMSGVVVSFAELNNTMRQQGVPVQDIVSKVLQRKDWRDAEVRLKIIELLPNMAAAFSNTFSQPNTFTAPHNFLTYSLKHYMDCIVARKERKQCYAALGRMFQSMSNYFRNTPNISDIFNVITSGFKDPFCVDALPCLGALVNISPFSRRFIENKVIDMMFRGGLTTELIDALKIIIKHVQAIRTYSQTKLKQCAAAILSKHSVFIDEKVKPAPVATTPKDNRSIWQGGMFGGNKPQPAPEPVVDNVSATDKAEDEVIFALEVLAMPEFFPKLRERTVLTGEEDEAVELLNITRDSVVRYMDDFSPKVRQAAAHACASVLNIVIPGVDATNSDFYLLHQLLDRLLIMGVGDDSSVIRCKVFTSIAPAMDRVLSLTDNVHCLIEALNDESLGVRAAAMTVLSRVAHYDTLHIMPVVRLTLKRLVYTLNTTQDNRIKLDSVQILQSLVRGSDRLVIPYVKQIIAPLMALLNDKVADVVVVALSTIGDLALSSPDNVREHLDELAPRLIEVLNDESSLVKQETAVVAMGKLVSSLATITEEPYKRYLGLFEGLVKAAQNVDESSSELRLQAIKTLGLLGAVDFSVYQRHLIHSNAAIGAAQLETLEDDDSDDECFESVDDDADLKLTKIEKHYFSVVIRGLMSVLKDSSLTFYHQTSITTAVRAIRILGPKADSELDEVMSGIVFRLYQADSGNNIKDALLDHFISLIHITAKALRRHTAQIIKIINDFLSSHLQLCLDIFESLGSAFTTPDFNVVLQGVLPSLLKVIEEECTSNDMLITDDMQAELESSLTTSQAFSNKTIAASASKQPVLISTSDRNRRATMATMNSNKTSRILQKFVNMSEYLGEYRRDLIPFIITILDSPVVALEVRKEALCTLMHVSNETDLPEFAGRIIHSMLRLMNTPEVSMQNAILNALACLICRLGTGFVPYVIPIRRKLKCIPQKDGGGKIARLEEYEALVSRLLKQRPLPEEPSDVSDITCKFDERVRNRASTSRYLRDNNFQINLQNLETAWALAGRNNASDLIQWMGRLTIELIRQSPSSIIRACATLAKTYRPLAEELFNSSFHSVWDELYSSQLHEVVLDIPLINGIETALESQQIPKNIMISLLNLAEFMEMQDKPLPIDVELLARRAQDANMFAKCLRFREIQFASKNIPPSFECIDAMVTVNNQLGLADRAIGILRHLRIVYPHIEIQPRWLEKLCRWDDAYEAYEGDITQCRTIFANSTPGKHERWLASELGRLRCLHALGESEELEVRAGNLRSVLKKEAETDHELPSTYMVEVQKLGANASWMLGRWDNMEDFLEGDLKHVDPKDVVLEHNVTFYQAVMAIHNHEYGKAITLINDVRATLSGSIGALLSESYSRAYRAMVTMQILAEMEEVVDYKQCVEKANFDSEKTRTSSFEPIPEGKYMDKGAAAVDLSAKKLLLLKKWRARLKWAPKDIEVYRQILAVHRLVAEPTEDLESWIELVTLCRKEGMYTLCANILRKLGAPLQAKRITSQTNLAGMSAGTDTSKTNDQVLFCTFQYWWSNGEKERALAELTTYLNTCALPEGLSSKSTNFNNQDATVFRVRCLLKRAEWMQQLQDEDVHGVLDTIMEARELAKDQYSVWHAWAVANYDQLKKVSTYDKNSAAAEQSANALAMSLPSPPRPTHPNKPGSVSTVKLHSTSGAATLLNLVSVQQADKVTTYVVEGIKGFVRSIVLGQGQPVANLLQDTLRLITLLFSYGSKKGVFQILDTELEKVSPDNWLSVVPQLIARIHVKSPEISGLLRKLLIKVAAAHPQALVCPISVALNTTDNRQRSVATDVLLEVRKNNRQLVEEATMVSRELMKVAITPHELWFDGLEQAAQMYMDSKDISGMLAVLKDLHDTMQESAAVAQSSSGATGESKKIEGFSEGLGKIGYSTLRDVAFRQNYAKTLQDAWFWIEQFRSTGRTIDLHQAWEIYQSIFKRIKVQIAALKRLELQHVSPALTGAKDLILAVPGTYKPSTRDISIAVFSPSVHVITSKQRPRRMSLYGADGKRYQFLLKGHEDLRQDERVMQLFGLINVCLNNDRITNHHGLSIVRYSVLPLSNNSGLIGWVENCDTLNQLIKQYREAKDIRLLIELKLLQSKCGNYDKLPVLHKAELFRQVLDETTGEDLAKMIWLRSKTSDVWIERRANFTKSLAVMSMVGYILGLGDRHPSNLMLDRVSGHVVHIDFGDCFEITAHRAKYPEIIPFRLTRMLTNCMGVAGIEGTYRLTSERVMRVMRDNRYSVMAMLEAFVYDPLISWRLLAKHTVAAADAVGGSISHVNSSEEGAAQRSPMDKMMVAGASFREPGGGGLVNEHVLAADLQERSPRGRSGGGAGASSMIHRSLSHEISRTLSQDHLAVSEDEPFQENLNARALEVINRIQAKLTGRDFLKSEEAEDLSVAEQVDRLIGEATSIENLCQLFNGWCPLW